MIEKDRSLHDNTLADISKREQICCRDNAPDEQDLRFAPPFLLEAYVKDKKQKR